MTVDDLDYEALAANLYEALREANMELKEVACSCDGNYLSRRFIPAKACSRCHAISGSEVALHDYEQTSAALDRHTQ